MTTPVWESGHLYLPGDLVQPVQAPAPASAAITNAGFESGSTDWTFDAGVSVTAATKFSGTQSVQFTGSSGAKRAIHASVLVSPGTSITANCMYAQGAASSGNNGGAVFLRWLDNANVQVGADEVGNLVTSSSGSGWKVSTVTAVAPTGAAKVQIGAVSNRTNAAASYADAFSWNYVTQSLPAGLIYKAVQTNPGHSGSTEPVWPSTLGLTVVDNEVTWEAVATSRVTWTAEPLLTAGTVEPNWPTTPGEFVSDGTIKWECISRRVEDEKCPNSRVVLIIAETGKVFAGDDDIVRFSATTNPLDWSSEDDAGFLPTGLASGNPMAVLAQYRANLAPFNADGLQIWQVDPDPSAMAKLDQKPGIGSTWPKAAQSVGNELFFLSALGVRSLGIAAGADNLAAGDIGEPVDVLVREAIRVANANSLPVLSTYYPGAGQYWLTVSNYPPPALGITGNVADGFVGDSGTLQYVASGGVLPYASYAISAGSLPPGASLNTSTGLLTFTYTTAGSYSWTVRVTDADGTTATVADSAVISAREAVVWNQVSKTVSIVNLGNNTQTSTIAVTTSTAGASFPVEILSAPGKKAYLRDRTAGKLIRVDITGATAAYINNTTFPDPTGMAINAAGTIGWVSYGSSQVVKKYDLVNDALLATSSGLSGSLWSGVLSPDEAYYYTTSDPSGATTAQVLKLNASTLAQVAASGNVITAPRGMAINPAGTRVYVTGANAADPLLTCFLTSDMSTAATSTRTNDNAQGVVVDSTGTYVYAVAQDDAASTYEVVKFNATTLAEVANVNIGQAVGGMLAFSADGTKLYASNGSDVTTSDTLSVIDVASFTVTGTITVQNSPSGIARVQP